MVPRGSPTHPLGIVERWHRNLPSLKKERNPAGGKPPTDPAAAALCALVSTGPNSTAIAAARCNAFKGCTTFARCRTPEYSPSHCEASSTTDVMADGGGVCYKYFTSGKDGLADNIDWVAWVKAH
jgi:hypothetical protein